MSVTDVQLKFHWTCDRCGLRNTATRQRSVICVGCGATYDEMPTFNAITRVSKVHEPTEEESDMERDRRVRG
jgi:ribosomal protein L37E